MHSSFQIHIWTAQTEESIEEKKKDAVLLFIS